MTLTMKRRRRVRAKPLLLVALSATSRRPHRLLTSRVEARRTKKKRTASTANNRLMNSSQIHIRKENRTGKGIKLRTRRVTKTSKMRGTGTSVMRMGIMEATRNKKERVMQKTKCLRAMMMKSIRRAYRYPHPAPLRARQRPKGPQSMYSRPNHHQKPRNPSRREARHRQGHHRRKLCHYKRPSNSQRPRSLRLRSHHRQLRRSASADPTHVRCAAHLSPTHPYRAATRKKSKARNPPRSSLTRHLQSPYSASGMAVRCRRRRRRLKANRRRLSPQ